MMTVTTSIVARVIAAGALALASAAAEGEEVEEAEGM